MNNLTARQKQIIRIINDNGLVTGAFIAQMTGFSLRTIQSEVGILKKNGIVEADKTGYQLNRSFIYENIDDNDDSDREKIIKRLLQESKPVSMAELCEEFYISESTLYNRLKDIDTMLGKINLKLIMKAGEVYISGSEAQKRKAIREMIYSDLHNGPLKTESIRDFFPDIEIDLVWEIIFSSLQSSGYQIQLPYSNNLILNIAIALYRIYLSIHSPDDIVYSHQSREYKLAETICDRFVNHFCCEATESDIAYIASLFEGQLFNGDTRENTLSREFAQGINGILSDVLESYMIINNPTSYHRNFILHVSELIHRGRHGNYVMNTNSSSMKDNSPFIYDVAVHFAKRLENRFQISIPEDEISFLAIHIGLIIGQEKEDSSVVYILLYASNYHGIADRIRQYLMETYGEQLVIHLQNPEIESIPDQDFDFIVSTVHLSVIGRKVIEVSSFFNAIDRANVDLAINQSIRQKQLDRNIRFLTSCFSTDLFFIRDDITTKDEAIDFLASRMIELNIVSDDYLTSVKEREELSPTCFFNSFAIPHSLTMDSKENMFAILINRKGIQWNEDNIKLCIMIALKKDDRHTFSHTYNSIVQVLTDEKRLIRLIHSRNLTEFISIITEQ